MGHWEKEKSFEFSCVPFQLIGLRMESLLTKLNSLTELELW